MSHDTETNRDVAPGGVLRGGRGSAVRLSPAGTLAAGLDEVVTEPDRGQPATDLQSAKGRFWFRRRSDLINCQMFRPFEIDNHTAFGVLVVLARLEQAIRLEAGRVNINGVGRHHWAYCGAREQNLRALIANERALLARLDNNQSPIEASQ